MMDVGNMDVEEHVDEFRAVDILQTPPTINFSETITAESVTISFNDSIQHCVNHADIDHDYMVIMADEIVGQSELLLDYLTRFLSDKYATEHSELYGLMYVYM
jgi:hypothetical protein